MCAESVTLPPFRALGRVRPVPSAEADPSHLRAMALSPQPKGKTRPSLKIQLHHAFNNSSPLTPKRALAS